ncbi:DUF2897 family protein [Shewanella youngdeokensis]|uniref:DUF2897 family protein n=1 Tax=Shewanella youngdeokensis TaxID=2999068 RepID=A0ABZ0JTT5_9GAMM|nr:DUF2897 family protein [Shewanella sp. DAU334]
MSDLEVALIIFLVIGVIASNIAVLKYSAKYKMPQFGKDQHKPSDNKQHATSKQNSDDNDTDE